MQARSKKILNAIDLRDREIIRLRMLVRYLEIELEAEKNPSPTQSVNESQHS